MRVFEYLPYLNALVTIPVMRTINRNINIVMINKQDVVAALVLCARHVEVLQASLIEM